MRKLPDSRTWHKELFVITTFIRKRAVNKCFHQLLLPQSKKKQLTVVAVASVGFGIQDQVQKFKCGKQSIHMIWMHTVIPTNLTPVPEKMEIHLKYRSILILLGKPGANVLYFSYPPKVTSFHFLTASQKCT